MRRLLATTSLALTFVAAPACDKKEEEKKDESAKAEKKDGDTKDGDVKAKEDGGEKTDAPAAGSTDLMGMVPDAAKIMATVDLQSLVGSSLYKAQGAALESSDVGKNLAAAKACNVGPETWKTLVLGLDPDVDDAVVIGMAATGIGKKENIECIGAKYKEEDPTADWKLEDKDGRTVVTMDGGNAIAYAVDEDTVMITSKVWDAAIQERIAGKGTAAKDGSLKDAMALADASKHVTFAGVVTPKMATGPLSGAKAFGGSLDLSAGLAIDAKMSFGDAGAATKAADELKTQFDGIKAMAAGVGVPQGVVDSVKIEAKDANLELGMKATPEELDQVGKAAMGAMAGGPPM